MCALPLQLPYGFSLPMYAVAQQALLHAIHPGTVVAHLMVFYLRPSII